jgi:hypothetical protein
MLETTSVYLGLFVTRMEQNSAKLSALSDFKLDIYYSHNKLLPV